MHIWIDIDKAKHIPLLKALINELKSRGHIITITAENKKEIKIALKQYQIDAKIIGSVFSIFGIFLDFSNSLRCALLMNYIKEKESVDIVFSNGSIPLLSASFNKDLPMILLIMNIKEKFNNLHIGHTKCFFLLPDNISPDELKAAFYDTDRVFSFSSILLNSDIEQNSKFIKEITNKIEYLKEHLPAKLKG